MSETYRFVVSIIGDPSFVSETTWIDHKEAIEKGKIWAERQPYLQDKEYTVREDLVIDKD